MMNYKKGLCALLTLALLLGLSIPAFAGAGSENGVSGSEDYVAYTVEEVKALTSPIPLGNSVIILDKTHNFTSDDYYNLVAAENAQSLPVILHPDTFQKDVFKAYENGTWPVENNASAIAALNALINRVSDAEYKQLAQDALSVVKGETPIEVLENLKNEAGNEAGDKTKQPETTQQPVTVSGGKFSDVDDNAWYATAVNYMASTGILNGYPDGTFKPNQPVTEAEFSVICWHLANITDPMKAATTPYDWRYDDVDTENGKIHYWGSGKYEFVDHWGACYTYGACKAGWNSVNPSSPTGVMRCNSPVLRGEAIDGIVVLLDDLGMLDTEVKQTAKVWTGDDIPDWDGTWKRLNGVTNAYTDDGKVAIGHDVSGLPGAVRGGNCETADGVDHLWTADTILKAYNYGVVSGVDEKGTCNPAGTLTRAELCQILYNSQLNRPRDLVGRPGTEHHGMVGVG